MPQELVVLGLTTQKPRQGTTGILAARCGLFNGVKESICDGEESVACSHTRRREHVNKSHKSW
eukprot:4936094-Amphidinium_carterae.2